MNPADACHQVSVELDQARLVAPPITSGKSLTGFQANCQTDTCNYSKNSPELMHAFWTFLPANSSSWITSSPRFSTVAHGTIGNDHIAIRDQM